MLEDVSDRRRLEGQLRQAQKMEAVGLLAGGIAHDFNNILTVIIGGLSLLSRRLRGEPALEREAADIQQAALRAADLTGQLLAFSRRQPLRPRAVDPNAVVQGFHRLLGRVIGESVAVELALDPEVRHAWADPSQLEQVLLNLAINARDAMPHGGTLTIETANAQLDEHYAARHPEVRAGAYVLLAVSDTGTGMDRAILARIFEPFFTTKSTGQGTGLGLATVYGVVKQSGGHVAAYSEPGRGSSFKVYLPVADERATVEAPPAAAPAGPAGGTVLVAEDEHLVREIARRVLEEAGYRVLTADDGDAALALASETHEREGRTDLLLTDVVMPGMSGPELARRMQRSAPGLRVVFMSGYPAQAVAHHGVHAPGEHFLQKPFQPDALVAQVAEALRR